MKLFLLVLVLVTAVVGAAEGRRHRGVLVGARSEVEDVKGNREIQELGRFSVAEFNYRQQRQSTVEAGGGGGDTLLMFNEVVEAEKQVVSGIKYYLKIQTTTSPRSESNSVQVYDAVVVVKPWLGHRQLVRFAPSSPSYSAN